MAKSKIEVEIKARAEGLEGIEERLTRHFEPAGEIDYRDTYYAREDIEGYTHERVRLRRAPGRAMVTAKERIDESGVEAGFEHEFEVSDPEAFERFVMLFGFRVLIDKTKRGRRFRTPALESLGGASLVVELVEIEGLGRFIEVEAMVDDESRIDAAKNEIGSLLDGLGVPTESIEERPYTLMLYEKRTEEKD